MNTRRTALLCLGLVATATLGLSGCGSSAKKHPAVQVPAKDSLLSSVETLAKTSYAVTLTTPHWTANGEVDPVGDSVTVTTHGERAGDPVTVETLTIPQGSWAKIDLGGGAAGVGIDPDKWLRLDPTRLPAGTLPFDQEDYGDAFDLLDILSGIISATRSGADRYAGTIDLTGVRGVNSIVPAGSSLGDAARNLPFSATTDAQGRLIDLRVGAAGAVTDFDVTISDYSAPAGVQPPDDNETVTAPAIAYSLLRADHIATD